MVEKKAFASVHNKRNLKRHYLVYYLRVFNRNTGDVIGNLIDINANGIMILRDSPIEVGGNYSLRLRWRNSEDKLQIADFSGICRWCRPDVNPDFYGAGFTITPANADDVERISRLIDDLSMPESDSGDDG